MHLKRSPRPSLQTCLASLAAIVATISLLTGCSGALVVLWTDRPDVAPAVELFNEQQDRYVVELQYEANTSRSLRLADSKPDIVIAESIEDQSTAELFRPLDRILKAGVGQQGFYQPLLENGVRSNKQHLLPVSFNLPLVFYSNDNIGNGNDIEALQDGITLSPSEMRESGRSFNEIAEGRAARLAFSPLWDGEFLYELVRFQGFVVTEDEDGNPQWSLDTLLSGVNDAINWVSEDNGGVSVDNAFQDQYLYDPIIRLVQEGRILFGYESSSSYFRRSDAARRGLQFRWLGEEGDVPVLENTVYAGIPHGAANRRGARSFLGWLFSEENQRRLLASNRQKRVDSFGIIGGFSALWKVTERAIPETYPQLESTIPPAPWFRFPPPSPRHWLAVRSPVVYPWLLREVAGLSQSRDLATSVSAWLLQQEE